MIGTLNLASGENPTLGTHVANAAFALHSGHATLLLCYPIADIVNDVAGVRMSVNSEGIEHRPTLAVNLRRIKMRSLNNSATHPTIRFTAI